ncbi:metallophosphoesterase family protein [Amaricoccus macauensis]|uniref:metallophosphoesterase family protein n=1 Tax=Amaricoccus macauensis TaxID=57001 RepID=UPI003C7DA9D2
MRRLLHMSDLHFGRVAPELQQPLLDAVERLSPDLVAVSGDLTQRARSSEFRAARAFLDRLPAPWLAVPGNHDVPLYNLAGRLIAPFRGYRRWISRQLEPLHRDPEMTLVGVNTVDPHAHQRGKIGRRAIRRAAARLGQGDTDMMRVLMVHHPFSHLPGEPKALMKGAQAGIEALSDAGVNMVLSGHLHVWRADPVATRLGGAQTLQIQAGTGLSTRRRGEENDFNLIEIDGRSVQVDRYAATSDLSFGRVASVGFHRTATGWDRL